MAATTVEIPTWRILLNKHPISKHLRQQTGTGTSRQQSKDTKSLICVKSSDIFIWNASEECILHCNLKALACSYEFDCKTESESSKSGLKLDQGVGPAGLPADSCRFQKLFPAEALSFEVEAISSNQCGSHLVLWGSHGVTVLDLPRRWGKNAVFEGGKETISCRTTSICERTLNRSKTLRVLQVSWHPGSKTSSHLAVLTSDNRFSVYSIASGEQPISSMLATPGDVPTGLEPASPGRSLVGAALGEVAVAFDFGLPITLAGKQTGNAPSLEVWPVYCVHGNGAIVLLYSHLSDFKSISLPVQGPLSMFPPAEDNYGVDACSVLVLPTPAPVLVVSTCEGRLHHCVQLPGLGNNDSTIQNDSSFSSQAGQGRVWSNVYDVPAEPILFVVETAVLELCLNLPQEGGSLDVEDEFMCPVLLKKDSNSPDRYHCSHSAGVHTVALPWLSSIQQFFLEDNPDFGLPAEKECIVEHVLCTKPLYSCPTSPVLGLDVVTDPLLGASLLILDNDLEFTALPIGLQYQVTAPSTETAASDGNSSAGAADRPGKISHQTRESFKKQVEQILQRKASVPILKAQPGTELSQQSMFQILTRVTAVLREEYIHRQDLARQEIHTRTSVLQQRKQHQQQDVQTLLEARHMLRESAAAISEKLEKCKDDHESLLRRLENCLRKLQSRVPILSEAERHEMKELRSIKTNMDLYRQNIEQVRVKQEYQSRQMQRTGSSDSPSLRPRQLSQIKDILQDESADIEELKKDITRLNLGVS